jgi:putative flavoprotein involved in K+ transport
VCVGDAKPLELPWYLPVSLLGVDVYWWTYLIGTLNAGRDSRTSRYVSGVAARSWARSCATWTGRVASAPSARVVGADGRAGAPRRRHRPDGVVRPVVHRLAPRRCGLTCRERSTPGEPVHADGASPVPGLHWMGLKWQARLNSSIIDGVDRDARAVAQRVRAHWLRG